MPGIFGDDFPSLLSPMATAQYQPTPAATFPNAPAPGPLAIPPAQPPIFLSPPDPAGAAPAQSASPWDSIISGLNHHALTLMALGAGIAQGGVGKGLAAAGAEAEGERNRQAQQYNLLQTYKALTDGGVPPQEAQAAVGNPSLMRALAAKYLGPRTPNNAPSLPAASVSAVANPSPTRPIAGGYPGLVFQGGASNAPIESARGPATPVNFPPTPPNVVSGAVYSPSRNMWKDGDGNIFDQQGNAVR